MFNRNDSTSTPTLEEINMAGTSNLKREANHCVLFIPEKTFLFENALPSFCDEIRQIYEETKEGNGQRWLMIPII